MIDVSTLVLAVDSTQVASGDRALDKLAITSGRVEKATDAMTAAYSAYGLAIGGAITATAYFVKRSIDAADAMNDLHIRTGLAFKSLAAYDLLAQQSGSSVLALSQGFKFLGKYMTEHADKLKVIGVTSRDQNTAMGQLANVISKIEDPALRSSLAMEILGRSGVELIPTLIGGSAAIDKATASTVGYGEALEFASPLADEFNDAVAVGQMNAKAFGIEMAGSVLPSLVALTDYLGNATEGMDDFNIAQETARITAETVAILFANMSFIAQAVGREIGGIAAQIAVFLQDVSGIGADALNVDPFERAATIRKEMIADSEKAAEALAKFEQRVLGGSKATKEATGEQSKSNAELNAAARKILETKKALSEKEEALKKAAEKVTEFVAGLKKETEQLGLTAIQQKMMEAATIAMTATTDKQRMAVMAAALAWADKTAKTTAETAATEAAKKAQDEWTEGVRRAEQAASDYASSLADRAIAFESELENYGRTKSEIELTTIARLEEQRAIIGGFDGQEIVMANLEKEIALRKRAVSAMQGIEERDAMKKASEESAREWARFADQVELSLTDALYRSFEAGGNFGETFARNLERTFKTMALKYAIQYVVSYAGNAASSFVGNATGGAVGNAGSAAGQWGGGLVSEGGKWVYNNGGQYVSSMFGGGSAAVGSYAGYGSGIAAGSSSGGLASSVYGSSMANATPAAGSGATAGASGTSWLPIIGWIIAGMTAANSLSKQGLGYQGSQYDALNDKSGGWLSQSAGNINARTVRSLGGSDRLADILSAAPIDNNLFNWAFGEKIDLAGSGLQLGVRDGKMTSGYNYQDWWSGGGRTHGSESGTNYYGLSGDQSSTIHTMLDGVTEGFIKPFNEAFATGLALNFDFRAGGEGFFKAIEAQLVKGIAESDVGGLFVGITDASGMMAAMQSFANVQSMLETINLKTDIKSAGTLAVGMGSENLTAGLDAYYAAFFSDQERATNQAAGVNAALTGLLGASIPKTEKEFRALVESMDPATEAGRNMLASLINIAPAFDVMIDNLDVAAGGLDKFTDSLIALRASLYTGSDSGLSSGARYAASKSALSGAAAGAASGDVAALETLDNVVREFLDASRDVARTSLDYARDRAMADAAISGAIGVTVPKFAAGGIHSGGARIVGENGPEIEFTGPSRIASHSQSKALLDNSEVVAELRAVRAELASLRAAAQSTATNTQRTEQTLRNVTNGGNTLRAELV